MDRIFLHGMRFMACHGVLPHEREVPQSFEADVELGLDLVCISRTKSFIPAS